MMITENTYQGTNSYDGDQRHMYSKKSVLFQTENYSLIRKRLLRKRSPRNQTEKLGQISSTVSQLLLQFSLRRAASSHLISLPYTVYPAAGQSPPQGQATVASTRRTRWQQQAANLY